MYAERLILSKSWVIFLTVSPHQTGFCPNDYFRHTYLVVVDQPKS